MKIEGNSPNPDAALQRLDGARTGRTGNNPAQSAGQPGQDRVQVSSDGRLVHSAMKAAGSTPAIRHEKVAAARQALADGRVGSDTLKLADKLIEHMLGQ